MAAATTSTTRSSTPTILGRANVSVDKQDPDVENQGDNSGTAEKDVAAGAAPVAESIHAGVVTGASERTVRGFRWILVCAAIFSANMLYGLDTTIVADIQGAVSASFDNVTQLGWLGVGFTLGSTVAILPLGKAFGIFDAKWVFIGCLVNFAAASALCGAAPNMNAMIVGRVWAGVGGAGMYLG